MFFNENLGDMDFDLGEEENLAILTFIFKNDYGDFSKLQKEIPSIDVYPAIYLEYSDRTVHNKFLGYSPDGKKHFKFEVDFGNESFWSNVPSFIDAGWFLLYDSRENE